jgi:hypothetical protein
MVVSPKGEAVSAVSVEMVFSPHQVVAVADAVAVAAVVVAVVVATAAAELCNHIHDSNLLNNVIMGWKTIE